MRDWRNSIPTPTPILSRAVKLKVIALFDSRMSIRTGLRCERKINPTVSMGLSFALGLSLATLVVPGYSAVTAPTPQDWTNLNRTVGGRLSSGFPWAKPCFSKFNGQSQHPDAGECQDVQQVYFNNSRAFFCINISPYTDNQIQWLAATTLVPGEQ